MAHEHGIRLSSEVLAAVIRVRKDAASKIGQHLDSTSPTTSADSSGQGNDDDPDLSVKPLSGGNSDSTGQRVPS